MSNLME